MRAVGDRLSTSLLNNDYIMSRDNKRNRKEVLDRVIYPDWVDITTRHFFPFFLFNLTQSVELGWAMTSYRLSGAVGGISLSESEDEDT